MFLLKTIFIFSPKFIKRKIILYLYKRYEKIIEMGKPTTFSYFEDYLFHLYDFIVNLPFGIVEDHDVFNGETELYNFYSSQQLSKVLTDIVVDKKYNKVIDYKKEYKDFESYFSNKKSINIILIFGTKIILDLYLLRSLNSGKLNTYEVKLVEDFDDDYVDLLKNVKFTNALLNDLTFIVRNILDSNLGRLN